MKQEESLRQVFVSVEVNADYSDAVLTMRDGSRLWFRHRVGQRWVRALGADGREAADNQAGAILPTLAMFRLNAKHLDVQFADGSRWEMRFADRPVKPPPDPIN